MFSTERESSGFYNYLVRINHSDDPGNKRWATKWPATNQQVIQQRHVSGSVVGACGHYTDSSLNNSIILYFLELGDPN